MQYIQKEINKQMALHTLNIGISSMSSHSLSKLLLSLLFISIFIQASACDSTSTTKAYKKFIKDECNSTTNANVCYKSLSPYASQIKRNRVALTRISVYVALKAAKNVYSTLTKLSNSKGKLTHEETLVIADCRENIDDAVDLLTQSAKALAHLNGTSTSYDRFQWDNIKTWMSAAITDETTCTDEFDEMEVRPSLQNKIKTSVTNVAWTNSNALALVNRLHY